jgi:hypothetical protein
MKDPLSIFVPANRVRLLTLAAVMATVIAVIDWWIKPYISLGFLYLFPIMIAGGFLSRTQIVIIALIFSVLDFRNFPGNETVFHILFRQVCSSRNWSGGDARYCGTLSNCRNRLICGPMQKASCRS